MAVNGQTPGTTPLDPDEAEGLLPSHITTKGQLDEWESENILEGERWAHRRGKKEILDEKFVRELHKRMFGKTWKWAGTFRKTEKSVGIAPENISVRLHNLLEDTKTQLEQKVAPLDEIAAKFHHLLVSIHPFPNGTGRHARLMTDLLLTANGSEPFSWGKGDLVHPGKVRNNYLAALRAADKGDYQPLIDFVRSGQ